MRGCQTTRVVLDTRKQVIMLEGKLDLLKILLPCLPLFCREIVGIFRVDCVCREIVRKGLLIVQKINRNLEDFSGARIIISNFTWENELK